MTDDIVARLRDTHPNFDEKPMCEEAADAIERLQAALQKITDDNGYTECCGGGTTGDQFNPPECCGDPVWAFDRCVKIARAALAGEHIADAGKKVATQEAPTALAGEKTNG